MPPVDTLDPSLILEEWINKTQNLPEEIRFIQDEIAEKDRILAGLVREIEERDNRIQKYIKSNGSHQKNPKEEEHYAVIRKNYELGEQLTNEKIALAQKIQQTMDKHIRHLDIQIKMLYDRNEPGFSDPDELPSSVRPSAANPTTAPVIRPVNATNPVSSVLNPIVNSTPQIRQSTAQRNVQPQPHAAASAPATPAASMILNRQAREGSAGPGGSAPKRGPRSNSGLGSLPTTSSGLARHSSLGPGTPKGQPGSGMPRAGSAGPRATTKGAGGAVGRKSTPGSVAGRKKGTPGAGSGPSKSGLSRVKRAAKNSPSSTADSELSDAELNSADESDAQTGGRSTPTALSRSGSNQASNQSTNPNKEGSHEREPSGPNSGPHSVSGNPNHPHHPKDTPGGPGAGNGTKPEDDDEEEEEDEDAMDVDEDDAGDDKKYCFCQNVSFGDMVACDNDSCPYEWFHWTCVGLKSEPTGKWYCPTCTKKGTVSINGGVGGSAITTGNNTAKAVT